MRGLSRSRVIAPWTNTTGSPSPMTHTSSVSLSDTLTLLVGSDMPLAVGVPTDASLAAIMSSCAVSGAMVPPPFRRPARRVYRDARPRGGWQASARLTNLGDGPTRLFVAAPRSPGRRHAAVEGIASGLGPG